MTSVAMSTAHIHVLVVTYNQTFKDSIVCTSLSLLPAELAQCITITCVVNRQAPASAPARRYCIGGVAVTEFESGGNGGLAGGYNLALKNLSHELDDYVLFMNADGMLEPSYLTALISVVGRRDPAGPAKVFCPTLLAGGKQVSPFDKAGFDHPFYIIGYLCVSVRLLGSSFSFPARFWLDGIDYWFSALLADSKVEVDVLPIRLRHDLSVIDQFPTLQPWRYRNILEAEVSFLAEHRKPGWLRGYILARALIRCLRKGRFDLARIPAAMLGERAGVR